MKTETKSELKSIIGTLNVKSISSPLKVRKRIGSTVYEVQIHFNQDAKETMNDKIMRLVRSEAQNGKAARL